MLKNIEFNFEEDWKNYALDYIKKKGYPVPKTNDLEYILYCYHSLRRRIIPQKPRKVLEANNFNCPENVLVGYELLKQNIQQGSNLNLYLSRKSRELNFEDNMFNDWGIQHFHLGTKIDEKINLIEGTNELLFAIVTHDTIYCIGIYQHGDWAKQEIISIIEENWQFLIEYYQIKDLVDVTCHGTDTEISQSRKNCVNAPIKTISGNVYFGAGGGINAAGGSANVTYDVVRTYQYILRILPQRLEEKLNLLKLNTSIIKLKFQLEITPIAIYAYCKQINLKIPLLYLFKGLNPIEYAVRNMGK